MENASKALIMAGSVFLAMLIIGALVLMYNTITSFKNTEATSEEAEKLAEYNKQIETFNRNLYGSEILSLANLIEDYNIRQSDLKGYDEIELKVTINTINNTNSLFKNKIYTFDEFINVANNYNKIELKNTLKAWENNQNKEVKYGNIGLGIKYKEFVNLSYNARRLIIEDKLYKSEADKNKDIDVYNVINHIESTPEYATYNNYVNLKSDMTEFKNKLFYITNIEYDEYTSRVTKMEFTD